MVVFREPKGRPDIRITEPKESLIDRVEFANLPNRVSLMLLISLSIAPKFVPKVCAYLDFVPYLWGFETTDLRPLCRVSHCHLHNRLPGILPPSKWSPKVQKEPRQSTSPRGLLPQYRNRRPTTSLQISFIIRTTHCHNVQSRACLRAERHVEFHTTSVFCQRRC